MQLKYIKYLVLLLMIACAEKKKQQVTFSHRPVNDTTIKYAKRFAIANGNGFKTVYLFGNRFNRDTTASFVLYDDTVKIFPAGNNVLTAPCKKIAALSSIYAAMFCELGAVENIVAIDHIDYAVNPLIRLKYKNGQLKELARTPEIDLEQTIVLDPDILFFYGMGDNDREKDKRLKETGIPVAVCLDHLEEHPLARAEWIKFFALFVNKKQKADSIFNQVEKNYHGLCALTAAIKLKPSVFSETKFGDVWYMPGGKSFMATLLKDAGADYLWKDNANFGSLPLSFEQVFARAVNADYWINLPLVKSKKELTGYESRYSEFKAYKNGNLFNNTKYANEMGYSPYWETGMIYPDRILSDLVQIFHPGLKEKIKNDLYYYERLK